MGSTRLLVLTGISVLIVALISLLVANYDKVVGKTLMMALSVVASHIENHLLPG